MSVAKKLRWKRTIETMRFAHEEHDYVKEVCSAIAPDFQEYYEKYCALNEIDLQELNNKNKEKLDNIYGPTSTAPNPGAPETAGPTSLSRFKGNLQVDEEQEESEDAARSVSPYELSADETAIIESFSKLFKRIALKVHPDKIPSNVPKEDREKMIEMFTDANKAFEDKKYHILLDIAEKLNISVPKNYSQQIRWMKREIKKVEEATRRSKNTFNYGFSEADTDEQRDQIIRNFLFRLFGFIQ
jgi:hypothetical protein